MEIPGTGVQRKSQGRLYSWRSPLVSIAQCNAAGSYNGLVDESQFCGGFRNATHRSPCMVSIQAVDDCRDISINLEYIIAMNTVLLIWKLSHQC